MCVNALSVTTKRNSQIQSLNATFSKLTRQITRDDLDGSAIFSSVTSSDTVEAIWNGSVVGIDIWVKNLAVSMTNVVRTSAPPTNSHYNGTAYQSGIRVRWE
jgi:aspartate/tyrosine/aromatic aminotransferase